MRGQTVTIIPGFGEGPWHLNRLYKALEQEGFKRCDDPLKAEIIITHSAGCFSLPQSHDDKVIILIGPPFWPGRSVIFNFMLKTVRDIRACIKEKRINFWLRKTFWNLVYLAGDIPLAVRIHWRARKHDFYKALTAHKVAIIRNQHDKFLSPDLTNLVSEVSSFQIFPMTGEHDDCWFYATEHAARIRQIYDTI